MKKQWLLDIEYIYQAIAIVQNQKGQLYIFLTDKSMGASKSDLIFHHSLPHQQYLIRPLSVHSPEQHQELISLMAKFKQFKCPHLLRLIDSHSVQAHNLCSVVSQLYLVIEKPKHTLGSYLQEKNILRLQGKDLGDILLGCSRGIEYLRREEVEMSYINEDCIFVQEKSSGEIVGKVMPPLFWEEGWNQDKTVEVQLGEILEKYSGGCEGGEAERVVKLLAAGKITLKQVEELLGDGKKSKAGLKLTKDIHHSSSKNKRQSLVSNSSSLMIDTGDVSDLMFRHFYEHFDDSISEISERECSTNEVMEQQGHQFPKKYLRSRAFRKEKWSEWKTEGQNLTRDESVKENISTKLQLRPFLLESAKMTESFVAVPYR